MMEGNYVKNFLEKLCLRKFNFIKEIVEIAVYILKVHVRVYRMNKFRNNITSSRSA